MSSSTDVDQSDPAAAETRSRGRPAKSTAEAFIEVWQAAESVEKAANQLGISVSYASYRASYLRKNGRPEIKDMRATRRKTDQEKWEGIPEAIRAVLGTMPDTKVSEIAGVTRERVRQWRNLGGVAKFNGATA